MIRIRLRALLTFVACQPMLLLASPAERTDLYGDPLPSGALVRMGTVRFRNCGFIANIALSPDGKLLAADSYNGDIALYNAATGEKLRQMRTEKQRGFHSLAFAPDGKTLASADGLSIQFWEPTTGKELYRFRLPLSANGMALAPFAFSPDGKTIASAASDHTVRIWDSKSGKELIKLTGHSSAIRCLGFSPDGKTLFSADGEGHGADGSARTWTIATGKELRTFPLRGGGKTPQPGIPLAFSPDGKTLAFAAHEWRIVKRGGRVLSLQEEVVILLDPDTGAVRRKLEPQEQRFKSAVFSRDGQFFAAVNAVQTKAGKFPSSYNVGRITVYETATGKPLIEFPDHAERFHDSAANPLAFAPDGKKLFSASAGLSSIHVWNLSRGRARLDKPEVHQDAILGMAFSADGRRLVTGSGDHTIALWETATGRPIRRLRGHRGTVASIAISADDKLLASSSSSLADQTVRLWDLDAGKELHRYLIPDLSLGDGTYTSTRTQIVFAGNGKLLASGGTDRTLRLWDAATGKEIRNAAVRGLRLPAKGHPNEWANQVKDVAFTADGRTMALCTAKIVSVVDVAAGQPLYQFEKDGSRAVLALSPDGKTLLHGAGQSVRLIEVASGADIRKLSLSGEVFGAAFSADGRTVAISAGEAPAAIHLFEAPSGAELLRLRGHESHVRHLVFSPDGTKLASGQRDSTALIWDVSAARRKLAHKDLTPDDVERLWMELRDTDTVKAHAALWTLAAAPDKAVLFLKEHLHPVPRIAADHLSRLIADLDADDFDRREKASRGLAERGIEIEPALRQVLQDKPSLEMRRRVEALLKDLSCQAAMTPDALRQLRSIQVLEQIGSAEARQILVSLAKGAAAAPATRDAAAAGERLAR